MDISPGRWKSTQGQFSLWDVCRSVLLAHNTLRDQPPREPLRASLVVEVMTFMMLKSKNHNLRQPMPRPQRMPRRMMMKMMSNTGKTGTDGNLDGTPGLIEGKMDGQP